jgi:hypothetical protein
MTPGVQAVILLGSALAALWAAYVRRATRRG